MPIPAKTELVGTKAEWFWNSVSYIHLWGGKGLRRKEHANILEGHPASSRKSIPSFLKKKKTLVSAVGKRLYGKV